MNKNIKLSVGRLKERATKRNLFLSTVVLFAFTLPIVSYWVSSFAPSGVSVLDTGIYGESSTDYDQETVAVYVQMLDFSPETRRAELAFYPWPTADIAKQLSSSVIAGRGMRVLVDGQNGQLIEFSEGDQVGGIFVTVDVTSLDSPELASDALYPFDSYVMESFAQVEILDANGNYESVQTFDYFYTSPVAGFDITYQRLGAFDSGYASEDTSTHPEQVFLERQDGKISFYAFIERSFSVKAIAFFIYGFILTSSLALVWIASQMVVGKKSPSMNALVWAAASMLGILELRAFTPGSPRVGVYADLFFFFPALMMSLMAVVTITFLWSTREIQDR